MRVLKILRQEMLPDPKRREKFRQEAKLAAHLKHPAIVKVFDVTQTPSSLQIEMEYIEGMSLRQHLEQRGRFPLPVALAILHAVLEGLAHAHAAKLEFDGVPYDGVIHRDLKPENILLRKDGQPVICDFGVAKLGADLLSMTQNISGSVGYMAPERLRGEVSSRAIDIFALGVTFFELLAGYRPFRGDNKTQVIENILKWNIADIEGDLTGMDPAVVQVIQTALARDPAGRYPDAGAMLEAVRPMYKLYHGELPADRAVGEFLRMGRFTSAEFKALIPEESPRRRRIWVAAAVVLALGGAGLWAWKSRSETEEPARDFAGLLEQGKLQEALALFPPEPEKRQEACYALARAHWRARDAAQALLWADKALDEGFHPRVGALRAEIYLEEGMRARANEELDRMRPLLRRAGSETRVQYHWLRVRWLTTSPTPLSPPDRKALRLNLEAVLRLVGHPSDPRRIEAQRLLSESR
jgi:tRNA A-37 threonylcarbamoyl transferase component Bud32